MKAKVLLAVGAMVLTSTLLRGYLWLTLHHAPAWRRRPAAGVRKIRCYKAIAAYTSTTRTPLVVQELCLLRKAARFNAAIFKQFLTLMLGCKLSQRLRWFCGQYRLRFWQLRPIRAATAHWYPLSFSCGFRIRAKIT